MIQFFRKHFSSSSLAILLLFTINLFFVFNILHTNLRDLNLWDESVYINTGRTFFSGTLTPFYRNPLLGIFYSLTYLPYSKSVFWLVQSATLGRILLFSLLWCSAYLVSRQTIKYASPLITVGFLLLFPVITDILNNPSDSLFAAMSGFACWQLLSFYNTQNVRNVFGASFFVGLSALSRNDGLISFAILVILILWLTLRFRSSWKWIPAVVIPFALIVGGYQLNYGLQTGHYAIGTKERSYVAFQQGQEIVYQKDPACKLKQIRCAVLQANQLYGSPEENNFSVLSAIANNPKAYAERVQAHLKAIPQLLFYAYGQRTSFLLLILALCGIYELIRKKEYHLLILLLTWMGYLAVYFLTFFRQGYMRTPFFIFFVLGAFGVQAIAYSLINKKEHKYWLVLLLALAFYGWFAGIQIIYFTAVIMFVVIALLGLVSTKDITYGYLAFLLAGLMLRPAFELPVYEMRGTISEEKAVLALAQALPENSAIASGAPGAVWMARMQPADVADYDYQNIQTPEELYQQFKKDKVAAIYVDSYMSNANEHIWKLIIPGVGTYYEKIYASEDHDIQVLLLK